MFRGTVTYHSRIPNLIFKRFEVDPRCAGVEAVELELPPGCLLRIVVRIAQVASQEDGRRAAEAAVEKVLNRLAYTIGEHVADCYFVSATFEEAAGTGAPVTIHPPTGAVAAQVVSEFSEDGIREVKADLEKSERPGERHFGLFRSAMKTENSVERFLHLYHILLLFYNDSQADVDAFIVAQNPMIARTPSPLSGKKGKAETVYTRLRNELAHQRAGVDLDDTKREMERQWPGLMHLVRQAINLNP
jgi:hypothetical protein